MFAMGNATFACGIPSAGKPLFEEACSEMEVWKSRLVPEPRPLLPQTRTAGTQIESQLEPATSAGVILSKTGQLLLLCSLQLWQQLQRCQICEEYFFFLHFTSVLRKQFAANDMFLREANSYKQALVLRNSRLFYSVRGVDHYQRQLN